MVSNLYSVLSTWYKLKNVEYGWLSEASTGCVSGVIVIGMESGSGKLISNSSCICCIHFRTNAFVESLNPFDPHSYGLIISWPLTFSDSQFKRRIILNSKLEKLTRWPFLLSFLRHHGSSQNLWRVLIASVLKGHSIFFSFFKLLLYFWKVLMLHNLLRFPPLHSQCR